MTRLRLRTLFFAALLSWLPARGFAQTQKMLVLLADDDEGADSVATKVASYMEDAIEKVEGYQLVSLAEAYGNPIPQEAEAARKKGAGELAEARKLLAQGQAKAAEARLRQDALKSLGRALPAMEKCGDYCEAVALLALAQRLGGQADKARATATQLLLFDKDFQPSGPPLDGDAFASLLREARQHASSNKMWGSVIVRSLPGGGEVYLDGKFLGYTPLPLDRVPAGKHLLRVRRLGSETFGDLITVTAPDELIVNARLKPTQEGKEIDRTLDHALIELDKGQVGGGATRLGSWFRASRAILGSVRSNGDQVAVECSLVDFGTGKRLLKRRESFESAEVLKRNAGQFVLQLLADADRRESRVNKKKSTDPLETHNGVEDWGADDRAPNGDEKKRARRGTDPLDDRSGTEDW